MLGASLPLAITPELDSNWLGICESGYCLGIKYDAALLFF